MSRRGRRRKILGWAIFALLVLTLAGGAVLAYSLIKNLPNPERITERAVIESTKIYDRTGEVLLYEIHGEERRTVLRFDEIPEKLRLATIVAEDINFYKHHGLDWRGILRALVKNVLRGDIAQGGSTITQQLIKNSILTSERTFTRKFREALLAILLENKYSKDEILELYLNQIPYGSNAYGIAAASDAYFSKRVDELDLNEIAVLAALPKAPTYYSPYGTRRNELVERKDWILDRMADSGAISKEDAEAAKKSALKFTPLKQSIRAPHFVMYVREYLNQKYGEEFVERGGLKVVTTIDWKLQEEAEKFVREGAEQNEKLVQAKNAAFTAINPKTGEILVMVGSRDYFDLSNDGNVNVTMRPRQPGSAFKPFVYATALKKGYTPETTLMDASTEFNPLCNPDGTPGPAISDPKSCYHPKNYDDKFRGPVTLRQSLAQSLNVPSVKLLYLAGIEHHHPDRS
jgi:membrane peptidoglycan carboxypeptidase